MRKSISIVALVVALAVALPAHARSSRDYFEAEASEHRAPQQLTPAERAHYTAVFNAIDTQDWATAQGLLAQRSGDLLHDVAEAELFIARGSPRVELAQIEQWMQTGRDLPEADQLGRLALTRGALSAPDLPSENPFYLRSGAPKRARPASVDDGTIPGTIRDQIQDRIVNDDPDGARALADGIDAALSPQARAEIRQRVAWSYYIENQDAAALAMAQSAAANGAGAWVAEADWTAGLAAWRLGDCDLAGAAFERSAYGAQNPELRAAAFYWASRSALRCRQPERSAELLRGAARADETLYGMLAAEQLGSALPGRLANSDFSQDDWSQIGGNENVRVAIALAEIGRDSLASEVLLHQARIGNPKDFAALSRLARDLGFPQTQLYMAYNAPNGGQADPSAIYPTPKWAPVNGWHVDPALAYAHTLQESNFRVDAVSGAQAQGLMQITPITVRQHAPRLGLSASHVDIFDPSYNLAFGQQNLEMLRDEPATRGQLPKIMAAYNAGLTPVTRWNSEINDQNDPLLYMESIPYWETRSYVAIVMRNYWMYQRQADAPSDSRVSLAQNDWPKFPGTDGDTPGSGRVYLSAGAP